ncbi:organic solvent tolerance protein OstA [Leptolyngbyaceae cyanobacterium JSC-12]|nr:organic solvent tolerance protein OstA [Leptolyngbyaceae cyanobacterium JSC-12]
MPYPALPPDLPPIVSVAPTETIHCSGLPHSQPIESPHKKDKIAGKSATHPESPDPQNSRSSGSTSSSIAEPDTLSKDQSLPSCAALLGDRAEVGKPRLEAPLFRPSAIFSPGNLAAFMQEPAIIRSAANRPISKPETLERFPQQSAPQKPQPQRRQAQKSPKQKTSVPRNQSPKSPDQKPQNQKNPSQKETAKSASIQRVPALAWSNQLASNSVKYSVSRASGSLSATPPDALVKSLNQALLYDALADSYQALNSLSAADLARLAATKSTYVGQIPPGSPNNPSTSTLFPPGGQFPTPSAPLPSPQPETSAPATGEQQPAPGVETPPVINPANVVEVTADRQEYDERRQIFTAEGKVMMRFRGGLLEADRLQVNLPNRIAVAEGNVALTRGNQVLRGQRFDYNFVQGTGTVQNARGDIFLPTAGTDTAFAQEEGAIDQTILARPLSDRITSQQPIENVTSPGGINISVGAGRDISRVPGALPRGGRLRRLRFEAEQFDFTPEGWEAKNIQITNDPFSPPELVLKAEKATLTRLSPLRDELVATRPRLVFDQKVSVPILQRRLVFDRSEQEPAIFRFGIDGQDRGGLFVEGIFNVLRTKRLSFSIYPQIFLQRMILDSESEGLGDPDNYGVRATLDASLTDRTFLRGRASLLSFDTDKVSEKLRASVRLQHLLLPTPYGPHRLAVEYSFRDRLFNGSLGFQTVQTSIGALLLSPNIVLGNTGLILNYQLGYQGITADTDRLDLLDPFPENSRVTLGRFQTTASLTRGFALWQGKPLPATRNEGLNYTPTPVIPYLSVVASLRGVFSSYTSGDTQQDLIGTVGLYGQFGHFSRRFFDYTSFGVSYTQLVGSGQSPFLFDRSVDNRVLTLSFFQQVYGPVRFGVQTSINVDTREAFSTDYFLEYSRRTHGIIFRYNPILEIGSISLRISDFNWTGTAEPFEGAGVRSVEGGVTR